MEWTYLYFVHADHIVLSVDYIVADNTVVDGCRDTKIIGKSFYSNYPHLLLPSYVISKHPFTSIVPFFPALKPLPTDAQRKGSTADVVTVSLGFSGTPYQCG